MNRSTCAFRFGAAKGQHIRPHAVAFQRAPEGRAELGVAVVPPDRWIKRSPARRRGVTSIGLRATLHLLNKQPRLLRYPVPVRRLRRRAQQHPPRTVGHEHRHERATSPGTIAPTPTRGTPGVRLVARPQRVPTRVDAPSVVLTRGGKQNSSVSSVDSLLCTRRRFCDTHRGSL